MNVTRCEACQGDSEVRDSRETLDYVRRRRECKSCKTRWTTFEVRSIDTNLARNSIGRDIDLIQNRIDAIKATLESQDDPNANR